MGTIETIVMLTALLLLAGWFIINVVDVFKKCKKVVKEANKDTPVIVKCEKCKKEHKATIDELLSTFTSKSVERTVPVRKGVAKGTVTKYNYFAKKIYCPTCKKKTWSEIKNYNELAMKNTKMMAPLFLKFFGKLLLGVAIIQLLMLSCRFLDRF